MGLETGFLWSSFAAQQSFPAGPGKTREELMEVEMVSRSSFAAQRESSCG